MSKKRIAVIPVIRLKGKHQLVLITSRNAGDWILPCGKYESRMSEKDVARLEAFEEAGITGDIDKDFIKTIEVKLHPRGERIKLRLFLMNVKKIYKKWPEKNQRKRDLIPLEKLQNRLCDQQFAKKIMQYALAA